MAATPVYIGTPKCWVAAPITTGDTSRTAPTIVTTVVNAGASGSRIDRIEVVATGTTVANVLRLFIHDGTNYRLWREVQISAHTAAATTAEAPQFFAQSDPYTPLLILPVGFSLRMTINSTDTGYTPVCVGGDF